MDNLEQLAEEIKEQWQIENDADAEWWIDKQNDKLVEVKRLKMSIENKINLLNERLQKIKDEEQGLVNHRDFYLRDYFERVDIKQKKETKTQSKYRLPSLEMVMKKPKEKFIRDDEALVLWLENNELQKYVEIKKSPMWGEVKKYTKVVGDVVVTDDGVILDGVRVEMSEPEFIIKE